MKTLLRGFACSLAYLALNAAPAQPSTVSLESPLLRLDVHRETGAYQVLDKQANLTWKSNPDSPRFGAATVRADQKVQELNLTRPEIKTEARRLQLVFHPVPDKSDARLEVSLELLVDDRTIRFSYTNSADLNIESVRLLDDALWTTAEERGYAVVPVREGLLIPADSGKFFTQRFDTFAYEGCHMEMLGLVRNGAAALLTWHDPYVAAELKSVKPATPGEPRPQTLFPSLLLRQSARSFQISFLGPGDHVTLAQAYRQVARNKGWLVTWDTKLQDHPERAGLFGAINFKLWSLLDRQMNEESTREESVKLNWTFDEAAQVAGHLKNDLKLEKVLFLMGGWIRRGYDNQHPDILPAAPECGGNEAFADCARRVRQHGYLLGLHDNYQDMYRDAPSWDETYLMRQSDGTLAKGGHWAGGRAYLTCSQKAVDLARRPQNLAAVKELTRADAYFIDTTYAAGLMECYDPKHPLTRWDDMKWKQAISDYARQLYGIFGSECGREWAIPHSDFFEGLSGVSGHYYHNVELLPKLGGAVVPLFELVYHECIAIYGKYGYDPKQAAPYVLHHITLGRPLHYHSVPAHLYWTQPFPPPSAVASTNPAVFTRADGGWAEGLHPLDRFVKNTAEILSPLNELTARLPMTRHEFLTPDRQVQRSVFGTGAGSVEAVVNHGAAEYVHQSKAAGTVRLPVYGFVIEGPTFVAFHARAWHGLEYGDSALFTLRSLDGQPWSSSQTLRVYHGFGDAQIRLGDKVHTVAREAVLHQ